MTPIRMLKAEHRLIERVLDALVRYAKQVGEGEVSDLADLAAFVQFFREFADRLHHAKEEDLLFAALVEEGGLPADMGPIAVMLDEHEQGRRAIETLAELAGAGALTAADRGLLHRTATSYAGMLRQHILKEDGVLYPMAEARLPGPVLDELERQFDRFTTPRLEEHAELETLGETLCRRYESCGHCGCGLHA